VKEIKEEKGKRCHQDLTFRNRALSNWGKKENRFPPAGSGRRELSLSKAGDVWRPAKCGKATQEEKLCPPFHHQQTSEQGGKKKFGEVVRDRKRIRGGLHALIFRLLSTQRNANSGGSAKLLIASALEGLQFTSILDEGGGRLTLGVINSWSLPYKKQRSHKEG